MVVSGSLWNGTQAGVTTVQFDLWSNLTVDSVTSNGSTLGFHATATW